MTRILLAFVVCLFTSSAFGQCYEVNGRMVCPVQRTVKVVKSEVQQSAKVILSPIGDISGKVVLSPIGDISGEVVTRSVCHVQRCRRLLRRVFR